MESTCRRLHCTDIARDSVLVSLFLKYIYSWFTKSVDQVASAKLFFCLLQHDQLCGNYFENCMLSNPRQGVRSKQGKDSAQTLCKMSKELVEPATL